MIEILQMRFSNKEASHIYISGIASKAFNWFLKVTTKIKILWREISDPDLLQKPPKINGKSSTRQNSLKMTVMDNH